jgi:hypothetical protein
LFFVLESGALSPIYFRRAVACGTPADTLIRATVGVVTRWLWVTADDPEVLKVTSPVHHRWRGPWSGDAGAVPTSTPLRLGFEVEVKGM